LSSDAFSPKIFLKKLIFRHVLRHFVGFIR
jgi:hypothetical protein